MDKKLLTTLFILTAFFSCIKKDQNENQLTPPQNESNVPPTTTGSDSQKSKSIIKIAVFGDLNGSLGDPNYSGTVAKGLNNLISTAPDIALGTGDFTSGEDYRLKFSTQRFKDMWSSFDQKVLQKLTKNNIPFAPTPGNHDANIERERGFYKEFWTGKEPLKVQMISTEMYPFYYSFKFKNIFFVSLDDVRTSRLRDRTFNGVTQRQWLENQLSSVESKTSIARIVYGHVPMYPVLSKRKHKKSKGRGKYYEILESEQQGKQVDSLEEILKRNNVSLSIFGHSHAYYPGVVQHDGERLDQSLNVLSMPCIGDGNRYIEGKSGERSQRGYGLINIDSDTGKINYDVYNYNGEIIDKATLPKSIKPYSSVIIKRKDLADLELNK